MDLIKIHFRSKTTTSIAWFVGFCIEMVEKRLRMTKHIIFNLTAKLRSEKLPSTGCDFLESFRKNQRMSCHTELPD